MISALLSFFGGAAFRMIWGEVSAYFNKAQDHKHEMLRMRLQANLEQEQHSRALEMLQQQALLAQQTIRVQADAELDKIAADTFRQVSVGTTTRSGIWLIDLWNGIIRPATATWSLVMITLTEAAVVTMSETTAQVCFAALGLYLADRTLGKRGK